MGACAQKPRSHGGVTWSLPGAVFRVKSCDRKLSPIDMVPNASPRLRPTPRAPYACSTYVSIDATCLDSCAFKAGGCYVRTGFTAQLAESLDDQSRGLRAIDVIRNEVELIDHAFPSLGHVPQDGARGGRDLRLHVGGDCPSEAGAVLLANAAERWMARGGGRVWTYTHAWGYIAREAWGPISVLASCETPAQARLARSLGYRPALVVRRFPDRRAFDVEGVAERVVPCPAETGKRTCVDCRLCIEPGRDVAIAFEAHGGAGQAEKARRVLPILKSPAPVRRAPPRTLLNESAPGTVEAVG